MDPETKELIRTLTHVSTVGMAMAFSIGIGAVVGHYLDSVFHTEPWLFIVFLGLGIAAAFRNLYRMYKKVQNL